MSPIILVIQDIPLGRTCVSWYLDEEDWNRGYPVATIDPTSLWIGRDAPREVARQASALFLNELHTDPKAGLSWLATHRVESGLLTAVPEVAA